MPEPTYFHQNVHTEENEWSYAFGTFKKIAFHALVFLKKYIKDICYIFLFTPWHFPTPDLAMTVCVAKRESGMTTLPIDTAGQAWKSYLMIAKVNLSFFNLIESFISRLRMPVNTTTQSIYYIFFQQRNMQDATEGSLEITKDNFRVTFICNTVGWVLLFIWILFFAAFLQYIPSIVTPFIFVFELAVLYVILIPFNILLGYCFWLHYSS